MSTHFAPAALKFLRGLTRHNDREWFNERKPVFERELKTPMLALIDEVNEAMQEWAPDHVRPASKCMMRIYRDTRFSNNKLPYKTQVASWWARHGLEKVSGGGFYFHVAAQEVTIAAGVYLPERDQLLAIRRHLEQHPARMRELLARPELQGVLEPFEGAKLTRAPRGFAPDSPALDLILQRQWGLGCTLPAEAALDVTFRDAVIRRFQLAAPLVAFLNEPLTVARPKPLL